MYDRPTLEELLAAVGIFLEKQIGPLVKDDPKLYYQTLIAYNLLKIAERELVWSDKHIQTQWERLNNLLEIDLPLPTNSVEAREALERRNEQLCERIRTGEHDEQWPRTVLFAHLLATTREQLEVANPKFLQVISQERATRELSTGMLGGG
jgi:hypothetical protein